jgi:GNAT superfamily N-acetyltransferase
MIITPYAVDRRAEILDLTRRAWTPVFERTRPAVPGFVHRSFYPEGWRARQLSDMSAILDAEPQNVELALVEDSLAGWVCTRLHPEDRMGEIHVLAVDPRYQRRGVATALMRHSFERMSAAGMGMAMVETGDDPGHTPARAAYEAAGFVRWPVARYFKDLKDPR